MAQVFKTNYPYLSLFQGNRYGYPWAEREKAELEVLFRSQHSLEGICKILQRPAAGVLPKLVDANLIFLRNGIYYIVEADSTTDNNQEQEVKVESNTAPVIETKTLIRGRDAKTLSDQDIFTEIARIEREVEKLNDIKNKPKKLQELILKMEADIQSLVDFVDEREEETA